MRKKIVRLTESQLYDLVEQTINEVMEDDMEGQPSLLSIADAFIGQMVNCGGDANRGGKTRQVGDAQWMDKQQASKNYAMATKTGPLYYDNTYMEPRMGNGGAPVLVLFDTQGRCITWIDQWKAMNLYNEISSNNFSNSSVLRLY